MTTLEDIKREQEQIREYLYQKPLASPVQYFILLGNRSIGKTHLIFSEMYKRCKENNSAFLYLFRLRTQIKDIITICDKYSHILAPGKVWNANGGTIYELDIEEKTQAIIGYYDYLNNADNKKTSNYDNPNVTDIFLDEAYTYKPLRDEYRKLTLFRGTVARRKDSPSEDIVIWMAGNLDMGVSSILEELKVETGQRKWRNENCVVYNSDLQSPDDTINIKFGNVIDKGIPEEQPVARWNYLGVGYRAYQFENHLYIAEDDKKGPPISNELIRLLLRLYINQKDFNKPIIYQTPKCLHIANFLKIKIF